MTPKPHHALLAALLAGTACGDAPSAAGPWKGLAAAGRSSPGAASVTSMTAADLTRDGAPDLLLVTRTPAPTVRIVAGTAAGFEAQRTLPGIGDPIRAAVGDLDGDGHPDVLGIGHFDNGFRVWLAAEGGARPYAVANHGRHLLVTHLDGDGRADVVAVHDGSGQPVTVTAYRGDGAGRLERAWELRTPWSTSQGICAADFDGDRRTDLAVVTGDPAAATVLFRGRGDGTFDAPRPLDPAGPAGAHDGAAGLACGDLDGDGRAELVTAHASSSYATGRDLLSVRRGSDPSLRPATTVAVAEPHSLVLADLDRDGRLDAVVTHAEAGELTVHPGRGDGTFAAPVRVAAPGLPGRLAAADFDRDGWTDVAVADAGDGTILLLRNRAR